jgi:alginate O-acetyltransferase complex protein AlgI
MTLAGLWHGAAWTYVVFGMIQGCWLGLHRLYRGWRDQRPALRSLLESRPGSALCVAGTFTTFVCTLVVFRGASLMSGFAMIGRMLTPSSGLSSPLHPAGVAYTVAVMGLCHALGRRDNWKKLVGRLPAPLVGVGYAGVLALALVFAPFAGRAFVYFQF